MCNAAGAGSNSDAPIRPQEDAHTAAWPLQVPCLAVDSRPAISHAPQHSSPMAWAPYTTLQLLGALGRTEQAWSRL